MATISPAEIQYQLAHIHEDRSSDIVISHIICLTLAATAVCLRFLSRRLCRASIQADDYTIIAALIFAAGEVMGGLMCVRYGGGKHAILLKNPETFAKWVLTTEMFMPAAIASAKISILLLYLRLFPGPRFRVVCSSVGAFIICCSVTQALCVMFQCRPIEAAWNLKIQGNCIPLSTTYIVLGSFNSLTDIIALVLPMPILWQLNTSRTRKIQLIGTFFLGGLVCVVSLYRIPKMADISLSDAPWSDVAPCVWAVVECCVGIFSGCLPTFPGLFSWKKTRDYNRPSANLRSLNSGSSFPQLNPDKRRSGYRSALVDSRGDFLKMEEWADGPPSVEDGKGVAVMETRERKESGSSGY